MANGKQRAWWCCRSGFSEVLEKIDEAVGKQLVSSSPKAKACLEARIDKSVCDEGTFLSLTTVPEDCHVSAEELETLKIDFLLATAQNSPDAVNSNALKEALDKVSSVSVEEFKQNKKRRLQEDDDEDPDLKMWRFCKHHVSALCADDDEDCVSNHYCQKQCKKVLRRRGSCGCFAKESPPDYKTMLLCLQNGSQTCEGRKDWMGLESIKCTVDTESPDILAVMKAKSRREKALEKGIFAKKNENPFYQDSEKSCKDLNLVNGEGEGHALFAKAAGKGAGKGIFAKKNENPFYQDSEKSCKDLNLGSGEGEGHGLFAEAAGKGAGKGIFAKKNENPFYQDSEKSCKDLNLGSGEDRHSLFGKNPPIDLFGLVDCTQMSKSEKKKMDGGGFFKGIGDVIKNLEKANAVGSHDKFEKPAGCSTVQKQCELFFAKRTSSGKSYSFHQDSDCKLEQGPDAIAGVLALLNSLEK